MERLRSIEARLSQLERFEKARYRRKMTAYTYIHCAMVMICVLILAAGIKELIN